MPVLQCTISGIDPSGFAFANVFHLKCDLGTGTFYDLLNDATGSILGTIMPPYEDACNQDTMFLDIAAKGVGADASYSFHRKISQAGTRVVTAALGAVCPLIRFLPDLGSIVGGMYAVGAGVADFVLDEIQPAYQALLADLADAMISYDGSAAPHHYQLCTYNPHGPVITEMKHREVPIRPTTLNKRMRA